MMVIILVIICLVFASLSAILFAVNKLQRLEFEREAQILEKAHARCVADLHTARIDNAAQLADMWLTVRACLDRRMLILGTSPLQESVYQEPKPEDAPETIDDIKRMLLDEAAGGGVGNYTGKIAQRRELIRKMRDLEERDESPAPRTFPQPVPYDPTANVNLDQ